MASPVPVPTVPPLNETTKFGLTALISVVGAWLTFAKLRDDRIAGEASREEKRRDDRDSAAEQAAGYYQKLTEGLMAERTTREAEMERLRVKMDELKTTVDELKTGLTTRDHRIADLEETIALKDARIAQLEGEVRQLKAVAGALKRARARGEEPDA